MRTWSEVPLNAGSHRFQTTRWSLVVAASGPESQGRRALEALCAEYWPPLYAFARRRGYQSERALDLTQGFFLDLLERNSIERATPDRGRFRTFLLSCFSNFIANQHDAEQALKRGGGRSLISLDAVAAEQRYGLEATRDLAPDAAFERTWALTLLDRVMVLLRVEYANRGRRAMCEALECYLTGTDGRASYKEAAAQLQVSEGAIKVTVHRMRQRYRELLLEEVSQTLDEGGDAKAEIQHLLTALGGSA